MGPWIILDKNVIQSLPMPAVCELSRYFRSNVTPVLLMEILADLSKDPRNADKSAKFVQALAHKALPMDSFTNMHYIKLCASNLLGNEVPMLRKAIIGGGQQVKTNDGKIGLHVAIQPENEAILRWGWGEFSKEDIEFALAWRTNSHAHDFDAQRRDAPKLKMQSLAEVEKYVDMMLSNADKQERLLRDFMTCLRFPEEWRAPIMKRWNRHEHIGLVTFAPYFFHCLRVETLFLAGVSNGFLSTKSTNIIDIEYLFYAPFCEVFVTGDKFLKTLATFVLTKDQSLLDGQKFQSELRQLATARAVVADKEAVEPDESSLIQELWKKHRKGFVPQARKQRITPERSAQILEEIRPYTDAAREVHRSRQPNKRFPNETW
jgi:hypothetical protein